jgi:hypothetical protein
MTRATQKGEELFYLDEFLRDQLGLDVAELKPAVSGGQEVSHFDGAM